MTHYIDYDPEQHEGKTLYVIEDVFGNDNTVGTEMRKVIDADEIAAAKSTPYFYLVDADE